MFLSGVDPIDPSAQSCAFLRPRAVLGIDGGAVELRWPEVGGVPGPEEITLISESRRDELADGPVFEEHRIEQE